MKKCTWKRVVSRWMRTDLYWRITTVDQSPTKGRRLQLLTSACLKKKMLCAQRHLQSSLNRSNSEHWRSHISSLATLVLAKRQLVIGLLVCRSSPVGRLAKRQWACQDQERQTGQDWGPAAEDHRSHRHLSILPRVLTTAQGLESNRPGDRGKGSTLLLLADGVKIILRTPTNRRQSTHELQC